MARALSHKMKDVGLVPSKDGVPYPGQPLDKQWTIRGVLQKKEVSFPMAAK